MTTRKTYFVDVILPLAVPNLYTYRVPNEWNDLIKTGQRVLVQFGKSRLYTAIVRNIHETPPLVYVAKYIESILDDQPIISTTQFKLWDWIRNYYLCHPGEVLNAALPAGFKLQSETKIMLNESFSASDFDWAILNENEQKITEFLIDNPSSSIQDVSNSLQIKTPQTAIKTLIQKAVVRTFEEVREKYKPLILPYLKIAEEYFTNEKKLEEAIQQLEKKAFKQLEVLLFVLNLSRGEKGNDWIKKTIVTTKFDNASVNSLIKKGILEQNDFETGRITFNETANKNFKLNELQVEAFDKINESFKTHDVCLLHGITGSGKTEVYFKLIEQTLAEGKQVLYLLPEIALTTQLIYRTQAKFGNQAGVYHSKFSTQERVEIWNDLIKQEENNTFNSNHYNIILGARSALFLPFSNLGLIIIDEEHESSFKQFDPAPRYNARDAALYLASLHKAKVVMGTATPSIETYYNATEGKYGFVELLSRYGNATLPEIGIADLRPDVTKPSEHPIFSSILLDEITATLKKKEQIILFQNRRGFAPYTECQTCAWSPHCTQCDVSLIYHKSNNKLICHYCGYSIAPVKICGACGGNDLRFKGTGTEKIEEDLEVLFPQAKITRLDLDSTRSKFAFQKIIEDVEEGNTDILVGTQMVTKGLDFDNVSLVGVLNADQMLNFPDFRAFERSFQLMSQVSGRAGRKDKKGKVIIQTKQPAHEIISDVIKNDYKKFYKAQLADRKEFHYPPFSRLIDFTLISKEINLLNEGSDFFANMLKNYFPGKVLGPQFPLVSKIRNEYLKRVHLKLDREFSFSKSREIIFYLMNEFRSDATFKKVRIQPNVDPI